MFAIAEFTEARLATVTNRSEKHGDEDKPAVSLGLEIETANTILDRIDPTLREALYKPIDESQDDLPHVERSTPVLRCNSIDRVSLPTKHEGWTLAVDDNIDESSPMQFGSSKCDKFTVEPKQGGTVILRMRIGTSDVDAERLGKLGMHVGQAIWITLSAPEKAADAIDGSITAFKKDHPDASDLFATGGGGPPDIDDSDSEGGDAVEAAAAIVWPFPTDKEVADAQRFRPADAGPPPQSVTVEQSQPGTRTARGRERTKRALAAGASS